MLWLKNLNWSKILVAQWRGTGYALPQDDRDIHDQLAGSYNAELGGIQSITPSNVALDADLRQWQIWEMVSWILAGAQVSSTGEGSIYASRFVLSVTNRETILLLTSWSVDRDDKDAGWLRILKTEKMLLTDSRNMNYVNQVRSSMHAIANSTTS